MNRNLELQLKTRQIERAKDMINNRINDIKELTRNMDITPTMLKNATEKYNNIAKYFEDKSFECDIFPIGSFATGTIVRPYYKNAEQDYDLDFICISNVDMDDTKPRIVKLAVKDILDENEIYKNILSNTEWDKCWTMEYAEVNGYGFNMDIIPAADNRQDMYSIAITNKHKDGYSWIISRPKAIIDWFNKINKPYLEYNRVMERSVLLEKYAEFYATVEEIPESLERSALQRVIQLMKRHRDIYYEKSGKDYKVASIIITSLVARIAEYQEPSIDFYELLNIVVDELNKYAQYFNTTEELFLEKYAAHNLIKKVNGVWIIENPVDETENLADAWREKPEMADMFFRWIKQLESDFISSINESDDKFASVLGNSFGYDFFEKSSIKKKYKINTPVYLKSTPKPYGGDVH